MKDAISNTLTLSPLEAVSVGGRLEALASTILEARYTGRRAAEEVCPQAVGAFRERVDDRLNPAKPDRGAWQGEFWGKWMLGAIAAYRYHGDDELRARIVDMVSELLETQDPNGYIGTYSNSRFGQVPAPVFEWNMWVRKYTLWGLVEAYELLGDDSILEATCRFVDHLMSEVGPGAHDIRDTGWKSGLPSMSILVPFVHLYRITEDPRHLAYAEYIVEQFGLHDGEPPDILRKGLSGEDVPDWFPHPEKWAKTYEFLSCCEGMVELYRVTGRNDYLTAARHIFASVAATDRHVTGTLSLSDHLVRSRYLVQSPMEVCDAVHYVRLAVELLELTGDAGYADEVERTLHNAFFGASGLDPFWGVRRQLLYGAHWVSPEHCGLSAHHCCVANLPRGLYQAMQTAVMQGADGPTVQLFMPGEFPVRTPAGEGRLIQETRYPEDGQVALRFALSEPESFAVRLRIPPWSRQTRLLVDGEETPVEPENGYVVLRRTWSSDSRVVVHLDMRGRVESLPQVDGVPAQPFSAVVRGPVVLARDIRLGDAADIHAPVDLKSGKRKDAPVDLAPVSPPEGVWMAFQAPTEPVRKGEPSAITLCDYASAGNTWDVKTSDFRVWLPDTVVDPRTGP